MFAFGPFIGRKSKRSSMDTYSSKRGVASSKAPKKGVGSRDANSAQDQNIQFCNRIGCSGRIKYANQNTKTGSSEIAKSSKTTFSSSNGSGEIEASSRSGGSVVIREKTSHLDSKRKLSSQSGFDQSQSSLSGNSEARSPTTPHLSGSTNKPGRNAKTGIAQSSDRSRKKVLCASNSNKQKTQTPSTSKISGLGTLSSSSTSSSSISSSSSSSSTGNRKCISTSDVATPSSSSSSGSKSPSRNVTKKRNTEGSSGDSSRGRQATTGATSGVLISSSSGSSSVSESRRSNYPSVVESSVASSVRTGGSANVNKSRVRLSYRQNGRNTLSFRESSEPPRNAARTRLSQQYSANASSSGSSSYNLSSSNDDSRSSLMPYTSAEPGYSHFMNRETLQRYNMEGIAEVLLALERIEQDEEMTHEQILALETSLFLSGLNLYDQHRDMRLDIDDMSYEELLALGERMGTVSTALSEKELSKCIKRRIYQIAPSEPGFKESGEDGDDVKCSVCQEEYVKGDSIGELVECEHAYHASCINQWLRLKNWCPICKTAAVPQSTSSS